MDKKKNYQSGMQDGDYCNVGSPHAGEGLMIEDHPRKCIEDKYPADAAATADMEYPADSLSAISYEPVKKHSAWWVWWAACLAVLVLIGSWLFYSRRAETGYGRNMAFNTSATKANRAATDMTVRNAGNSVVSASKSIGTTVSGLYSKAASATSSAAGAMKATIGAGASKVANIIYYFGNNESTVADNNAVLNQAAADVAASGADVTVTAYASNVGNPGYNEELSERRAKNVAAYLVAHGVPKNHVKVVGAGESESFGNGNPAYNRRANIHIDYNG
ncbi:OmpA family protein [uncultured Muribaculum sp.]|uniref:OmpA family protein n=1 Tax=uncultured Muribaculum sp. TaxID=1918613 RepID=UPI00273187E2|nr:OmpA family protein [uncultured Muribaculum sp.]